jgi:geranylgeranyl pyrophosphate synthase
MLYLGEKKSADLEEIQRIYEESGALEKSILKMKSYASDGISFLEKFDDSEAKRLLIHLMDRYYLSFNPEVKLEAVI